MVYLCNITICQPIFFWKKHNRRRHNVNKLRVYFLFPDRPQLKTPCTIIGVYELGQPKSGWRFLTNFVNHCRLRVEQWKHWPFFFLLFFSIPFTPEYCLRPSIFSLLVVTQIRGHIAGPFPPPPTTVRALHFYREKIQLFVPSSTRVELCLPTLGALSSWSIFFLFLQMNSKSRPWAGFELTDQHYKHSRATTINSPPWRPAILYSVYKYE